MKINNSCSFINLKHLWINQSTKVGVLISVHHMHRNKPIGKLNILAYPELVYLSLLKCALQNYWLEMTMILKITLGEH